MDSLYVKSNLMEDTLLLTLSHTLLTTSHYMTGSIIHSTKSFSLSILSNDSTSSDNSSTVKAKGVL
jgi:hypothetical protein